MYKTTNELNHFQFEEAYVDEIRMNLDTFVLTLENVKILPENSCNRDIRLMRTNGIEVKIPEATIESVVEEGYRRFDPDGKLIETVDDKIIEPAEYTNLFKSFEGSQIYSLEKKEDKYLILVDAPEHIYDITVTGGDDIEEWERFINV